MGERKRKDAPASEADESSDAPARSGTLKGGHDAAEMGRRSAASRRERAAQREAEREDRAMTVRQRLAVALSSELTIADWRAVVKVAKEKGNVTALARLADQAFGKPQVEEEDAPDGETDARSLSRAQRSAVIARLLKEEEEQSAPQGDASDPRGDGAAEAPLPAAPHPPE